MGKYLRTQTKGKWRTAWKILLVVATVLLTAWAYGYIADHPDVWSQRPPHLDGGIAIIVSMLAPFAVLAYLADRIHRRKEQPDVATNQ